MACQVCQIGSKGQLSASQWTSINNPYTNIYYETLPTNELIFTAKMYDGYEVLKESAPFKCWYCPMCGEKLITRLPQ